MKDIPKSIYRSCEQNAAQLPLSWSFLRHVSKWRSRALFSFFDKAQEIRYLAFSLAFLLIVTHTAKAQSPSELLLKDAAKRNQFAFVFFYEYGDEDTRNMYATLKESLSKIHSAVIIPVPLDDPQEEATVQTFGGEKLPAPLTVGVAPNGAICSVSSKSITREQILDSFVSASQADYLKAIQSNQIAIVCLQAESDAPIPDGVIRLQQDASYKHRTKLIRVLKNAPSEKKFLELLSLSSHESPDEVALIVAPGTTLGRFTGSVSSEELNAKVVAAGKCCDDQRCGNHDLTINE